MVAVVIQAASAVVEELRALVHVPLEKYFHYLPRMPNGEKPADLVKAGFPQASDLLDGVLLILALTALRVVVTPLCLEGLGRVVMKHRYYQTPANPTLDAMLQEDRYPGKDRIAKAAKEAGLSAAQVSVYCRHARNREREGKVLHKFTEVAWKLGVHVFLTCLGGYAVMVQQPWFWDPDACWARYPKLPIPRLVYWYYMLEFGTFGHEMLALFVEARRSDHWAMLTHHVATMTLIAGSYICNFVPIGALVMITHDAADSFLEIAKIFNYMCKAHKWAQKVTDFFFVAFAVVFFVTRLIVFPFHVFLRNSVSTPRKYLGYDYAGVTVLNFFLFVLICLHVYWMAIILRMAVKMAMTGKAEKDGRSDDEEDYEASDGEKED